MSRVFTTAVVAGLRLEYGSAPWDMQPFMYRVATDPALEIVKSEVEGWLNQLSAIDAEKFISRLRKPKLFNDACSELAVAHVLWNMEYELTYERDFVGLKPDWWCEVPNLAHGMVVEVKSDRPTEKEQCLIKQCREILRRISELPVGALIVINLNYLRSPMPDGEVVSLIETVRHWLIPTLPPKGAVLRAQHIVITFKGASERDTSVQCGAYAPGEPKPEPLAKKIIAKANDYRRLVQEFNVPLVVAIVPDFLTCRSPETFMKAVPLAFGRCKHLSAALWVEKDALGKWTAVPCYNPTASVPLAKNALGESPMILSQ